MTIGLATAFRLAAEEVRPLAPYQPPVNHTSTLRLWGDRHMAGLAQACADGFHALHPEIGFEIKLLGNGTAMPALYLGQADVVFFGRDLIVTDKDGFNHVMKYDPLRIELGTGSLATPGNSPALALLVHRDNPLAQLTLSQVDAIFSNQRRRGNPSAIRTWGQLGLTGEWADRPIHLYADDTQSVTALFFQRVALGDSRRMNWKHFTEFQDIRKPDGTVIEAAQQSAAALAADRYGLAVSNLHYLTPALKALALAERAGESFVLPTPDTLIARRYPLARPIFACANLPPGRPLDPKVRDFLRYVVGQAGQRTLTQEGSYLPLSAETARDQLRKLE
jgi:phosphate transport system substrate-binding protein